MSNEGRADVHVSFIEMLMKRKYTGKFKVDLLKLDLKFNLSINISRI